jgi:imidazolonepropionase-like amidohydrolase
LVYDLCGAPGSRSFSADVGYIFLAASAEAERTLLRGFTTVRDLGGPSFALKQAIDEGLVTGPRIYPSGAMITTTGGHGDMRPLSDLPRSPGGPLSYMERTGAANIADSAEEIRLRVREQLLQGASQIQLGGGGGVASPRTTLDMFSSASLSSARVSRPLPTGIPTWLCTPIRLLRSSARSPRGSSASSTDI